MQPGSNIPLSFTRGNPGTRQRWKTRRATRIEAEWTAVLKYTNETPNIKITKNNIGCARHLYSHVKCEEGFNLAMVIIINETVLCRVI